MKTIAAILIFLNLLLCTAAAVAQCPSNKYQWDFSGSFGLLGPDLSSANSQLTNKKTTTQPQATYFSAHYFIYNRLAIGLAMGINTEKGTFNDATFPSASTGSYTVSNKTVAMELYYIYLFRKYIELYTFAGVGPTSSTEQNTLSGSFGSSRQSESKAGLKGQYTPIGIRAGGRLGAYAELGYGYKGLVNLGISFKLGPSCWWSGDF